MTILRMDNVGVVVDDLAGAIAFFVELGLELEGETTIEGSSVDRLVGLDDVRTDIALMRTPDGHGRVELMKFQRPMAVSAEPKNAPANTLGIRRIMFAVDDIEDVVARLRAHGAQLVGELTQYEDKYRLCYVRGPEGILVALAEELPTAGRGEHARLYYWRDWDHWGGCHQGVAPRPARGDRPFAQRGLGRKAQGARRDAAPRLARSARELSVGRRGTGLAVDGDFAALRKRNTQVEPVSVKRESP